MEHVSLVHIEVRLVSVRLVHHNYSQPLGAESAEVAAIMADYGLTPEEYNPVVNALRRRPKAWVDFMMKYVTQPVLSPYSVPIATSSPYPSIIRGMSL